MLILPRLSTAVLDLNMPCPCGSTTSYIECCQPLHLGLAKARTPEALMRSRFSAYAKNLAPYIVNTYANKSRKDISLADIEQWAKSCIWLSLTVHLADFPDDPEELPTVEFTARYCHDGQILLMREISRFCFEDEHWRYLDGDIINHSVEKRVKSNDPCPCQSGNKFKKCCGK